MYITHLATSVGSALEGSLLRTVAVVNVLRRNHQGLKFLKLVRFHNELCIIVYLGIVYHI